MAEARLLRFSATLQLNSRAKGFAQKAQGTTEVVMRKILDRAEKIAKRNVAKGKGPSPHPHRQDNEYIDTGYLSDHVHQAIWPQGFLYEGSIFTDVEYGVYLEIGWRTKKKNFFRYPWLKPAFMEALKLLPQLAAETFRSQMKDFDEDTITDGAALESWAGAAQRWADDMKRLEADTRAKAKPKPILPTHIAPNLQPTNGLQYTLGDKEAEISRTNPLRVRNPKGRPRDVLDLGVDAEMKRDARRGRYQKRAAEKAEEFDVGLIRRSKRQQSEATRRAKIDPVRAAEQYEREQARVQAARDRERREAREASNRLRAEAEARQNAVRDMLAKANDQLRKKTSPNVKPPKPPRAPSIKRPRKKK